MTKPAAQAKPKPRPPLAPRIDHYTITKDGKPTKLAPTTAYAPYGILGEVALECGPGDKPMRIEPADDLYSRSSGVRSAYRRAMRIAFNTTRVIEQLAQSIHYDCPQAKQLGAHGKIEIITVYAERECSECGCRSRTRSAKRGPKGKPNAYWVEEDLCSACDALIAEKPTTLVAAFAKRRKGAKARAS